jgi:hypothetical protein
VLLTLMAGFIVSRSRNSIHIPDDYPSLNPEF